MSLEHFEALLKENYDKLVDPMILYYVGLFFDQNPKPSESPFEKEMSVVFIKRLTKVASHALDEEVQRLNGINFSADFLAAGREYCLEGIRRIESGRCEQLEDKAKVIMHGHFYSHLASFEKWMALHEEDSSKRTNLLHEAYKHRTRSMEICGNYDPEYAAFEFGYRSAVAHQIANDCEPDEKKSWLLKAVEDRLQCARRMEEFDLVHSGMSYTIAGDLLYEAYLLSDSNEEREQFLDNAIENCLRGINLVKEKDCVHAGVTYANAGKFARALWMMFGNNQYRKQALEYYSIAINMLKNVPEQAPLVRASSKCVNELKNAKSTDDYDDEKHDEKPHRPHKSKGGREKSRLKKLIEEEMFDDS